MRNGQRACTSPTLKELRARFAREFARLPDQHKALRSPKPYQVTTSSELESLQLRVTQQVMEKELGE